MVAKLDDFEVDRRVAGGLLCVWRGLRCEFLIFSSSVRDFVRVVDSVELPMSASG